MSHKRRRRRAFMIVALLVVCSAQTTTSTVGAIAYGDPETSADAPAAVVGLHRDPLRPAGIANRFCTGTVVAKRWVLTAAHCTDAYERRPSALRVGVDVGGGIIAYNVERIVYHPRRPKDGDARIRYARGYDIALLQVGRDIKNVAPVSVAQKWVAGEATYVMYGFGLDEYGEVSARAGGREVSIVDANEYGYPRTWPGRQFATIGKIALPIPGLEGTAAFETTYDSIARSGDSGGPVLRISASGKTVLVGIVSYGPTQGGAWPTVHTKLPYYAGWIAATLRRGGQ